jgi:hypothetical protein
MHDQGRVFTSHLVCGLTLETNTFSRRNISPALLQYLSSYVETEVNLHINKWKLDIPMSARAFMIPGIWNAVSNSRKLTMKQIHLGCSRKERSLSISPSPSLFKPGEDRKLVYGT